MTSDRRLIVLITAGDIGPNRREIEIEPIEVPIEVPAPEKVPA